jgi:hypothetical protein
MRQLSKLACGNVLEGLQRSLKEHARLFSVVNNEASLVSSPPVFLSACYLPVLTLTTVFVGNQ